MTSFRSDMIRDVPERRGKMMDIWIFVPTASIPVTVTHSQGQVPVGCQIIDKDKACDFYRQAWDRQKGVFVFSASAVNVVLRFEFP